MGEVRDTGETKRRVRVFVSYADDAADHADAVLRLGELLRDNNIDVRLDKWAPHERLDWGQWTAREIRDADFVLAAASPGYVRAADGAGDPSERRGAKAELALLRELLQQDRPAWTRRILPVVLPGQRPGDIPDFLSPFNQTHYLVREFSVAGAIELLRLLTDQPAWVPPPLGRTPHLPPNRPGGARPGGSGAVPRAMWVLGAPALMGIAFLIYQLLTPDGGGPLAGTHHTTLVVSSSPLTASDDKLDIDTNCPGRGSQPQIIHHCGDIADVILDSDRLHTADDEPRLLLAPAGTVRGTGDCRRLLSQAEAALTGAIDGAHLVAGADICTRTDQNRIAYLHLTTGLSGDPATVSFTWAVDS